MEKYALEALNISKKFPGVVALDDVNLKLRKNEVLGLVGENGAGKSTLLRVLAGIYPYGNYDGDIKINGESVAFKSPHDALGKGIGYVPQEINVMDDLTVAENIFVGHLKENSDIAVNKRNYTKRAEEFFKKMHVDINPALRVQHLSIGQKQFLMLMRALSWNPSLMILDEPTTSLSHEEIKVLFDTVRDLTEKGKSIIFVTHKLEEIFELTQRVLVLRDGKQTGEFEREKYSRDILITSMVGRDIDNLYPSRNTNIGEEKLRVENLTVEHPRIQNKTLIENISFNVRAGEVLGLAGLVGSGRTETVSAIFGQYPLKSGDIFIKGKKVNIRNESEAIAHGMSFVTEDRKGSGLMMLADIKTNIVLSNLKAIKKLLLLNKKKEKEAATKYMWRLKIKAPNINSMVANLSGGNQQKVVLAKTLNTDPEILILDEPTKGIDVGTKNEIYQIINELAESGIAVIMISSELPEVIGMCDRIVVLCDGEVSGELDITEANEKSVMELCFAK